MLEIEPYYKLTKDMRGGYTMSLIRPFSSIRKDFNRLFSEMDQEFYAPWSGRERSGGRGQQQEMMNVWAPAIDVIEEENRVVVRAQVPGIRPEDLDIEVDTHTLTISGKTSQQVEEEKGNVYRREIVSGRFYRQVGLPAEVKGDQAQAHFENGILRIELPKSEQSRRHKIKLNR